MTVGSKHAFQQALKHFVQSLALARDTRGTVRVNTPLFASRLIRSIEVFDLIVLIEELTGRAVPDEEVTLRNLRSIQAITEAFWEEA